MCAINKWNKGIATNDKYSAIAAYLKMMKTLSEIYVGRLILCCVIFEQSANSATTTFKALHAAK